MFYDQFGYWIKQIEIGFRAPSEAPLCHISQTPNDGSSTPPPLAAQVSQRKKSKSSIKRQREKGSRSA
jgi:hypothetical protein